MADPDFSGCCGFCNSELSDNQPIYDKYKVNLLKTNKELWSDIPDFERNSRVATKNIYASKREKLLEKGEVLKPPSDFFTLDYDRRKMESMLFGLEFEKLQEIELISSVNPNNLALVKGNILELKECAFSNLEVVTSIQLQLDSGESVDNISLDSLLKLRVFSNTELGMNLCSDVPTDDLRFLSVINKHTCNLLRKLDYNENKFSSLILGDVWDVSSLDVDLEMPEIFDFKELISKERRNYESSLTNRLEPNNTKQRELSWQIKM